MRKILVALCLAASVLPAQAISRYESMQMSCGEAQARIQQEGAVILRYRSPRNPSLPLYDRYVASARWCNGGEYTKLEAVPTADTNRCTVYRCFPITWPFDND